MSSLISIDGSRLDPSARPFTGRRFVGFILSSGKEPPALGGYLRVPCTFQNRGGIWVLANDVEWPRARQPWGRIAMVGVWLGMGVEDYDPLAVQPLDVVIAKGNKLRFAAGDLAFDKNTLTDFAKSMVRGVL